MSIERFRANLWDDRAIVQFIENKEIRKQMVRKIRVRTTSKYVFRRRLMALRDCMVRPNERKKLGKLRVLPRDSSFNDLYTRKLAQNMSIQGRTPSILVLDILYLATRLAYIMRLPGAEARAQYDLGKSEFTKITNSLCVMLKNVLKHSRPKHVIGLYNTDDGLADPVYVAIVRDFLYQYDIPAYDAQSNIANYIHYLVSIHGVDRPIVAVTNDIRVWSCSDPIKRNVSSIMFLSARDKCLACPVTDDNVHLLIAARIRSNKVFTRAKLATGKYFGLRYAYLLLQRALYQLPQEHGFFGDAWRGDYGVVPEWAGDFIDMPSHSASKTVGYALEAGHRHISSFFLRQPDDMFSFLFKGSVELALHLRTRSKSAAIEVDIPFLQEWQAYVRGKLQYTLLNYKYSTITHHIKRLSDVALKPHLFILLPWVASYLSRQHHRHYWRWKQALADITPVQRAYISHALFSLVRIWPPSHSGHSSYFFNRFFVPGSSFKARVWTKYHLDARATSRKISSVKYYREFSDYRYRNNVRYVRAERILADYTATHTLDEYLTDLLGKSSAVEVVEALGIQEKVVEPRTASKRVIEGTASTMSVIEDLLYDLNFKGI